MIGPLKHKKVLSIRLTAVQKKNVEDNIQATVSKCLHADCLRFFIQSGLIVVPKMEITFRCKAGEPSVSQSGGIRCRCKIGSHYYTNQLHAGRGVAKEDTWFSVTWQPGVHNPANKTGHALICTGDLAPVEGFLSHARMANLASEKAPSR
mmetsp:Transcript_118152/g.208853  ORF Transcript_118152/g.208853 Transcript_118152/m.208853 type:complete len:150 (-) Transcript_118152:332-781(-)